MTLPPPGRHQRTMLVWPAALALAVWASLDGGGFVFAGPETNTSATYTLLREFPFGMQLWGALLLALALAITYGIGRDRGGNSRPLNVALGLGCGFWILWGFIVVRTWVYLDEIPAWSALTKAVGLTAIYYLCGRGAAPRRDQR